MATRELKQTRDLVSQTEEHGITMILKNYYRDLMSLGPEPKRGVCRLLRDHLMSALGLNYFTKLNWLVRDSLVATTKDGRDDICRWIDNDVMEAFSAICETDVFDDPVALSALSDVAITLNSSLETIKEELIQHEVDYLLDIPYQLSEMVKQSPQVPRFYKQSFQREEKGHSEKISIQESNRALKVSYTYQYTS